MRMEVQFPSIELIQKYIDKFDNNNEFTIVELALSELFERYPNNQDLQIVLIKVIVLDSLYNTNIRMGGENALVKVANHILSKNIDGKLKSGLPELVDEIALINIEGNRRRNYSFASKYCHWHQPEIYPIYDSFVDHLLWAYREQDNFMMFKRIELQQYSQYKEVIKRFREFFELTRFDFKELDKFLWGYGKELFGNKI
jgi:hypothetical protein